MKPTFLLFAIFFVLPSIGSAETKVIVEGKVVNVPDVGTTLSDKPLPSWIWGKNASSTQYLRYTFDVSQAPMAAHLSAACDNSLRIQINGKEIVASDQWEKPVSVDVLKALQLGGKNILTAEVNNDGGAAGFILKLDLSFADRSHKFIMTGDDGWKISDQKSEGWMTAEFDTTSWKAPEILGELGVKPWGIPNSLGDSASPLSPSKMKVAKDFSVELLYTVPADSQGSWISLTKDGEGRLIASDQGEKGLFRIAITDNGPDTEVAVDRIPAEISGAMGLTWAHDSLYAHVSGKGLFRLTDQNGDGSLENIEALGGATGGGEHGNHAVILAEDGADLLVIAGNHTPLPSDLVKGSTHGWEEDLLLPRQEDPRGHARGVMAPGGWICRVTPDGKNYTVQSTGYRNEYDIALNRFGDLFTYDADMEWDMGTPWYRPTRICLALSGSEYGWRNGSGKWPSYYEDSLPPLVEIGPGSPTGVVFGTGGKFPGKYQDAMFSLDWTFGTIYAIHPTPSGAGYTCEVEEFISGAPLPVTDAIIGKDGNLYFTTGGRGTQSALYRAVYTGNESTETLTGDGPPEAAEARALRRSLEAFHGNKDLKAIEAAWPHLKSKDRFLRHAARVAIEAQPPHQWVELALAEQDPQARVTALVALARSGKKELRPRQIASLLELKPDSLDEGELLGMIRAYVLTFMRLGDPDNVEKKAIINQLFPLLPTKSDSVNTELVRTLIYLDAPGIVSKTMDLIRNRSKPTSSNWGELVARNGQYGGGISKMLENPTPAAAINFAFMLRNIRYGWTMQERRDYFTFLNEAGSFSGGASYSGYLTNTRNEALANASAAERASLADLTGEDLKPGLDFTVTAPKGPGKNWTTDAAVASIEAPDAMTKRNFQAGRNLFHASACASCHQFDGEGGAIGPDLSTVRNKFSTHDLLEAIVEPSKVISDQYGSSTVTFLDGKTANGIVVEKGDLVEIYSADPKAPPLSANHSDIASIKPFPVSQMPPGLINPLSEDELRDLIAYLMSRGNPKDSMFAE